MQREIKFRCFVYSTPSGLRPMRMHYKPNDTLFMWDADGVSMHIMQFTGAKDRNGIDVYEGDILKGKDVRNFLINVQFDQDNGCWHLYKNYRYCEVVGNIYENPELLADA